MTAYHFEQSLSEQGLTLSSPSLSRASPWAVPLWAGPQLEQSLSAQGLTLSSPSAGTHLEQSLSEQGLTLSSSFLNRASPWAVPLWAVLFWAGPHLEQSLSEQGLHVVAGAEGPHWVGAGLSSDPHYCRGNIAWGDIWLNTTYFKAHLLSKRWGDMGLNTTYFKAHLLSKDEETWFLIPLISKLICWVKVRRHGS